MINKLIFLKLDYNIKKRTSSPLFVLQSASYTIIYKMFCFISHCLSAFSPIDLIPDFIPIIGYLDDLIIVPIGIYLCLKLIPNEILTEMRKKALDYEWNKSKNWFMAILILSIWFTLLFCLTKLFISYV